MTLVKKDILSSAFNASKLIYNHFSTLATSIPKDLITEIHLRFFRHNKNADKKILGYWDFSQRMNALGDIIIFLEILSVLRSRFNLNSKDTKNIDFCFIDDTTRPKSKLVAFSKPYQWKKLFRTLPVINPYIDSVFYFSSNKEFERFYLQNKDRYIRWPPMINFVNPIDCKIVEESYKTEGNIPLLDLPVDILNKTYHFYESNVYPSLPVVLNIRNNSRNPERNPNLNEYKRFLESFEDNDKYKFIIICYKEEIPGELRKLKNVIFSKDHFSDIEYDLALIKTSYLSVFPGSGMSVFAWFSDVPYIQLGYYEYGPTIPFKGTLAYTIPQKGKNWSFSKEYQRIYHEKENSEKMISYFKNLVNYLEVNKINNNLRNKVKDNKQYRGEF